MPSPRPLSDGERAGWGLMALILAVSATMVAAVTSVAVLVWKRFR